MMISFEQFCTKLAFCFCNFRDEQVTSYLVRVVYSQPSMNERQRTQPVKAVGERMRPREQQNITTHLHSHGPMTPMHLKHTRHSQSLQIPGTTNKQCPLVLTSTKLSKISPDLAKPPTTRDEQPTFCNSLHQKFA